MVNTTAAGISYRWAGRASNPRLSRFRYMPQPSATEGGQECPPYERAPDKSNSKIDAVILRKAEALDKTKKPDEDQMRWATGVGSR
jgi:hypothetical protein